MRNLLTEAVDAVGAVPSFDMGFGPKLYEVPGAGMRAHDLTEMQLIDYAIKCGAIRDPG